MEGSDRNASPTPSNAEIMHDASGVLHAHFLTVTEALKLIGAEFDGLHKERLQEFCENVEMATGLVKPEERELFDKLILTKITKNARSKLLVRADIETWNDIKGALHEYYSERRTVDFYACQLFAARQGKNESIARWAHRVDRMGTELRNAMVQGEPLVAREYQIRAVRKLVKASFVQGIRDERIQSLIKSRDAQTLEQAVNIATEEETAIVSAQAK
ncbi:uncharacterized protein [Anabrus simplex]|uniref:uncharacterized protein n=1 Tax=Anabrus simplex TaxID=316456 RepID=UPI0034DCD2E9